MHRKVLPDLLKGIAVILMIQVHIMELFMLPDVYDSTLGRVSLFFGGVPAAPVFMAVMGYFTAISKKSNRLHFWRGLKLIGLGFFLNLGLNAHLLIRIIRGDLQVDPWPYIFGADILFLAGLGLIFISFLRYFAGRNVWVFLAFTIFIPFIADFVPVAYSGNGVLEYVMAFVMSNAWWSYFPFFPWAGWILAGYSFALLELKYGNHGIIKKYGKWLVYLAVIPVLGFLPWAFLISTNLSIYYRHGLWFFLWGIAFLSLWIHLFRVLNEKIGDMRIVLYLQWFGRNVTLAYVIQWMIIGNVATAIYKTQPAGVFWLSFVVVVIATSMLITLLASPVQSLKNRLR